MTRRYQSRETFKAAASLGGLLFIGRLALVPSKGRVGDWLRTKVASAIDVSTEKLRAERAQEYAQRGQAEEFDMVCSFFHDVADSMRENTRVGAANTASDEGIAFHRTPSQYGASRNDFVFGAAEHPYPTTGYWETQFNQYLDQPGQTPTAHPQRVAAVGRVGMPRPTF